MTHGITVVNLITALLKGSKSLITDVWYQVGGKQFTHSLHEAYSKIRWPEEAYILQVHMDVSSTSFD